MSETNEYIVTLRWKRNIKDDLDFIVNYLSDISLPEAFKECVQQELDGIGLSGSIEVAGIDVPAMRFGISGDTAISTLLLSAQKTVDNARHVLIHTSAPQAEREKALEVIHQFVGVEKALESLLKRKIQSPSHYCHIDISLTNFADIQQLRKDGKKIAAIKMLRTLADAQGRELGLRESKEMVEHDDNWT